MDVFETCSIINEQINLGNEREARNQLIKLLSYLDEQQENYNPLINNFIRQLGLYPYLESDFSDWQDAYIYELYKTPVGNNEYPTLHREQAKVLKRLLDGDNLALSAPTSFGKSFIIDAFIEIRKPKNIVIIVPTIALMDETRRRLQKRFGNDYKIITTTDVELVDKNIIVLPQERAINYIDTIDYIDIFVVDEFYKADPSLDKERSPALLKAILKLGAKAKQKYFLAPNITDIKDNLFTKGMDFLSIDFNTVYLEKHDYYKNINKDINKKKECLLEILNNTNDKTLIYAGVFSQISAIAELLTDKIVQNETNQLLLDFESWLNINYSSTWNLTELVRRGIGIHTGRLHRSLSQIQIKLFEESQGLNTIISTSSIIEGVNTCAKNIVVWLSKNGRSNINNFTYKNIIGRGGRMFKHFIGNIYILASPPKEDITELQLDFPNELLDIDITDTSFSEYITEDQFKLADSYKTEMISYIGESDFEKLHKEQPFLSNNSNLIRRIAGEISHHSNTWENIVFLNSSDPEKWTSFLYKAVSFTSGIGAEYTKVVNFIKLLTKNWEYSIPELLSEMEIIDVGIDDFFNLERNVTYKLSSIFNDINILQKNILKTNNDISPFITRLSYAFLPPLVYQLEEYGLPRMISKKIHNEGIINFLDSELKIHDCLDKFRELKMQYLIEKIKSFDSFDKYIIKYFYDGI